MSQRLLAVVFAFAIVVIGCDRTTAPTTPPSTTAPPSSLSPVSTAVSPPTERTLPPGREDACRAFDPPTSAGSVASAELTEASGLVASRTHPGVLWAHNDSGDAAAVYAVGTDGSDLGRFRLTNAIAIDWEDMARGPGPDPDRDYLYLGDIGDNLLIRSRLSIYRIPEPEPGRPGGVVEDVELLTVTYGEVGPFNAEAMTIDPFAEDLLVITKRDAEGRSIVFRSPLARLGTETATLLEPVAVLTLGDRAEVTAADITDDGGLVALRGYSQVWMWVRTTPDIATMFEAEPCLGPSPTEIQGEALAFDPVSDGYFTVSEGSSQAINYVGSRDS